MRQQTVDKQDVKALFERLQLQGYHAYMNYMCCSGCAGAAIANTVQDQLEKGTLKREDFRGAVFFHEQDAESWEEGSPLPIRYGPVEVDGTLLGLPAEKIGQGIVQLAKELGITVSWDGNPNTVVFLGK